MSSATKCLCFILLLCFFFFFKATVAFLGSKGNSCYFLAFSIVWDYRMYRERQTDDKDKKNLCNMFVVDDFSPR